MAKRKIVDAHHHLWDLGRGYNYPWLQDKPSGDGMLGNLAPIARDYLVRDYRADTANYNVVGSVHIEAVPADPIIETRWLQETTKSEGLPSGIVARVELQKPGAEKAIAEHISVRNVRGIRQIVNWHQHPKYTFTDHDFLIDGAWLSGFRLLRKYGLSFDLQLYPAQMGDAVELARRNPETLIVVNHTGMPLERDEAGLALWRDGMKRLGAEPNVVAKISGLGMVDRDWSEASIRPFVLGVIDRFGVDRVMFGSNFPVDKLYSSFDTLYGSFESIVASFSESEKEQLFCETRSAITGSEPKHRIAMARFRLLTPDAQYVDDGVIERQTAGGDVDWDIRRARSLGELPNESLGACDGLVVWHEMKIDAAFVSALRRCRIIVRAGVGFDHIDLTAAAAAGIPVCNTPDYGTSEVADHAIGLMLALRRGIVSYHQNLVDDPLRGFDYTRAPLVRRLRGRVFGVIGLGRIGVAAAIRAKAFGMNVVAYDPYVSRGSEIAVGVDRVESLRGLLAVSDVVSLHCPLTDETREMINAATIAEMKRDSILINTARGAVVEIRALLTALRKGEIAGAGIDVLPIEPPENDDALAIAYRNRADPIVGERLIVTPHAAWSSPESVSDARRLAVETAMFYLREGKLRNLVNAPSNARVRGAA